MDTIAAIATAAGGGVGIVRISGPASEAIVRQLVPTLPKTLASHKLYLGEAIHPRLKDALDQVLVVLMRAPRSYTGDDVAELHGHGGHATLNALLGAVLGVGARLATPGEFTRRAFLAGKIDLSQAEAVSVLIGARDERTARAAQALRRGAMGKLIDEARGIIVAELAEIEGALDFPDEVDSIEAPALRATRLQKLSASLRERVGSYSRPVGMVPDVLLVGRVNAGKSSLLNAMVGRERALVDEEPGTTRDAIEAELELPDGTLIRVVDTAGERAQASGLEQRGRAIARARWGEASLVLCVFDRSLGWSHLDEDLRAELAAAELPMLFVENKADLPAAREEGPGAPIVTVRVSARTGEGITHLGEAISTSLTAGRDEAVPIGSVRQAQALGEAAAAIERATHALTGTANDVAAPEVSAVELRRALHALGQVTGETVEDAVLDAIFSRFCIGK